LMLPDWHADTRRSFETRREVSVVGWGRLARSLYVFGDQIFTHLSCPPLAMIEPSNAKHVTGPLCACEMTAIHSHVDVLHTRRLLSRDPVTLIYNSKNTSGSSRSEDSQFFVTEPQARDAASVSR
jgi:hypothetical protein